MRTQSVLGGMMLAVVLGGTAMGALSLDLPSNVQAAPGTDFTLNAVFHVSAPDLPASSLGYSLSLGITGPDNGVTITGASAKSLFGSDGTGTFVAADPSNGQPVSDVYYTTDFLFVGDPASLQNGTVFTTFMAHVAPTASGVYQAKWYMVNDAYRSVIYDGSGAELSGVTFGDGSITVPIPEPLFGSAFVVASGGLLLRRRAATVAQ